MDTHRPQGSPRLRPARGLPGPRGSSGPHGSWTPRRHGAGGWLRARGLLPLALLVLLSGCGEQGTPASRLLASISGEWRDGEALWHLDLTDPDARHVLRIIGETGGDGDGAVTPDAPVAGEGVIDTMYAVQSLTVDLEKDALALTLVGPGSTRAIRLRRQWYGDDGFNLLWKEEGRPARTLQFVRPPWPGRTPDRDRDAARPGQGAAVR